MYTAVFGIRLMLFRHGDLTEVGEKGISLSGGQKQRINIARALYFGCDITLFDDSFSALDAHVGQAVFDNVVRADGALDGKTRVLVTHKLDFLPHVDYIITLSEGKITEQGTYAELMAANGFFAKFIAEFSTNSASGTETTPAPQKETKVDRTKAKPSAGGNTAMMQSEERATGSVSWKGESLDPTTRLFTKYLGSIQGLFFCRTNQCCIPPYVYRDTVVSRCKCPQPVLVSIDNPVHERFSLICSLIGSCFGRKSKVLHTSEIIVH